MGTIILLYRLGDKLIVDNLRVFNFIPFALGDNKLSSTGEMVLKCWFGPSRSSNYVCL